ncbi:hypothetical protein AVEN_213980-1 [Araneus ventricosus]|uniref:Uncharacterized protein n=1 Tax=Araneus ventricosus TaxID=182803 RepID=A0A4Y2W358_ARAVE|nr:hypothetical protein AVEN_117519-1 [Araneus ventricosus]GBO30377.1 hypothetical protein AVEN_213980-1 [Araneus ventricosus]
MDQSRMAGLRLDIHDRSMSKLVVLTNGSWYMYVRKTWGVCSTRKPKKKGNECADQLDKEAITKGDPFLLPKPLSYLKSEIRSAALSIWQDNWDNGETGRSTHDIVPRVSNKPVGWNREEIMFLTGLTFHTFFASIFEHMTTARAEKKEIQFTMPQNVCLPSLGISKLLQCHLNYSDLKTSHE